ncbi:FxsA family membrane protein [Streptomyces sp. VRA16 Mangrove soil]|uniref:FxsA family membrane protein n=1 Tax=Streptomyces sp. VRA16 Mangrove soil TaxID=2817434 RepID=UPI001A9E745A|nr:FxsA family membrane protein [Streptomyces sp. VRA16 Mangrove soil]MBO1331509.1 FxsA family protein [Streptomyces sp. VRA16 Mangrove soil]
MTTGTPPRKPATARRSRVRTFLPLGIAAWVVLEIWLATVVAQAIGGFTLFLIMVASVVLGAVVIKAAGRRAFQNLNETLRRRQQGVVEAGEQRRGNGLLLLAGLFLIVPGLISDAFGLLLLIPPVRVALSRYTERTLEKKMSAATPGSLGDAFQQARMHQPGGTVIQGEVVREDEYPGPRRDDGDPRPPIMP